MTPSNKFNSVTVEVTADPPICNVVILTSPDDPYTTALLFTTVPAVDPSTKFNSVVDEVIPSNLFISDPVAVIVVPA